MPPPPAPVSRRTAPNRGSSLSQTSSPLTMGPPQQPHSQPQSQFSSPQLPQYQPQSQNQSQSQQPSPQQQSPQSQQQQQPQLDAMMASLSNLNMAGLPQLPPGFDFAQYGSLGFEMAIRMGMGIAMGMNQANPQAGPSTLQPQPPLPSQPTSIASASGTPSSYQAGSSPDSRRRGKSVVLTDILADDLFGKSPTIPSGQSFAGSRRPSITEATSPPPLASPDEMVKRDPLATQVWKAYAKARDGLPNGPRMENLTWRMMHLTMRKQDEPGTTAQPGSLGNSQGNSIGNSLGNSLGKGLGTVREEKSATSPATEPPAEEERGRSKGKSRVVGFTSSARQSDDV